MSKGLIYFDAKLQRIEGLSNDGMHELMQMLNGVRWNEDYDRTQMLMSFMTAMILD
jgi:hypothetical protein